MKKLNPQQQLVRLSEQIGNFIEYWGFKKIHGMIWTHLYLSPTPLSAQELINRLKVSKALISLSMKDLLHYELILQTEDSMNKKNKFYVANPDVFGVIRKVLETRELNMIRSAKNELHALNELVPQGSSMLSAERMNTLKTMTEGAEAALQNLIQLSKVDPSFLSMLE